MDDCWKISEEPELEANLVRDSVATIITNLVDLFGAVLFWRWVPAKLYVRTAAEAAAMVVGFKAEKGARLNLDGTGQYQALPCITNIINTTSKALATGGEDFARAAVRRERRSTGGSSSGAAVDEAEVDAKFDEFRVTSSKEERWEIIKSLCSGAIGRTSSRQTATPSIGGGCSAGAATAQQGRAHPPVRHAL